MLSLRGHSNVTADRKRCRIIAAFLVLTAVLTAASWLASQTCLAEDDGNDRVPHISDWGIFDASDGTRKSLADSGVVERESEGTVFYIQFDHNVAERSEGNNVADNNCSLISVVSGSGVPVAASVWVKDTQLEFQYRQCIFITINESIDESDYYHIVVAPGITAKNGYTNNEGSDLYFAFPSMGSGEEPSPSDSPDEVSAEETESVPAEPAPEKSSEKPAKDRTDSSKKPGSSNSGNSNNNSSAGTQRQNADTRTSDRTGPGNSTAAVQKNEPETFLNGYRIDPGVFYGTSGEPAAEEEAAGAAADSEITGARSIAALSIMITLCLMTAAAGAVGEEISFRHRLGHRQKE